MMQVSSAHLVTDKCRQKTASSIQAPLANPYNLRAYDLSTYNPYGLSTYNPSAVHTNSILSLEATGHDVEKDYLRLRLADILKTSPRAVRVRAIPDQTRHHSKHTQSGTPPSIHNEQLNISNDDHTLPEAFTDLMHESSTLSELSDLFMSAVPAITRDQALKSLRICIKDEIERQRVSKSDSYYWASRFRSAQSLEEGPQRSFALNRLADDFRSFSSHYSETLVYEVGLPEHLRNVNLQMLVESLEDPNTSCVKEGCYLYAGETEQGNDELAMKAASRELLAASEYSKDLPPGYSVPMQCIVDFLGFRIISMPLLPIKKETIVYGSNDGMKNVLYNEEVHKVLQTTAERLHLAEHPVQGYNQLDYKMLCTAGDVEIHLGEDGSYYILDLARVFPPVHPETCFDFAGLDDHPWAIFYHLFRPEFLEYIRYEGNVEMISSDAFSGWGNIGRKRYDKVAIEAAEELICVLIPKLANKLDSLEDIDAIELSNTFHEFGVNMRFLGSVYLKCNEETKWRLAREMIVRTLKNALCCRMRSIRSDNNTWISPFSSKIMIANFLSSICNDILDDDIRDDISLRMIQHFGDGGFKSGKLDHIIKLDIVNLVIRVLSDCGISMKADCIEEFSKFGLSFTFSTSDIESFRSQTSSLTLLRDSHAQALYDRSMELDASPRNQFRHLKISAISASSWDIRNHDEQALILATFTISREDFENQFSGRLTSKRILLTCFRCAVSGIKPVLQLPRIAFISALSIWDEEIFVDVSQVLAATSLFLEDHPGSWSDIMDQNTADELVAGA